MVEDRGEEVSSNFLLLGDTVGRGSDVGLIEAECHNNIARTRTHTNRSRGGGREI